MMGVALAADSHYARVSMEMETAAPSPLLPIIEKYFDTDPLAAAQALESMGEAEAVQTLKCLPMPLVVEAFDYMNVVFGSEVLEILPPEWMPDIVRHFDAEKAASYFLHLPNELRKPFLRVFSARQRKQIRDFVSYPEDSAGRAMSRRYMAFKGSMKVKQAVARIRRYRTEQTPTSYMYVVDNQNHLIGIMSIWDMILADESATLESLMKPDVFTVNCFDPLESVASEMSSRNYFSLPVVDAQRKLLGVLRADDLIEDVQEEASEDFQRMFGAGGDERVFSPVPFSLRHRLPWLHVNLATAFLAAMVVGMFEDIIARVSVLAVFLPVVAGQGGNAGAQSLAVVMRGLVMREIPGDRFRGLILKETWIGLINGIIIGLVTGLVAWLWQGSPWLGVVIGLGMVVNLVVAGAAGAGIPLVMKSVGLDPAQCSNIILTTVTDVLGFLAFLGFAVIFQSHLVSFGVGPR